MSKKDQGKQRARYTLEFKLEAVRLVKAGQEATVTARVLGVPKQTLSNWVRLASKGELQGAGDRPVSAQEMELARLRHGIRHPYFGVLSGAEWLRFLVIHHHHHAKIVTELQAR